MSKWVIDTYFVKKGLWNGEEGMCALTSGVGEQQADGWYWLVDGMDDGVGPFPSKEAAQQDADIKIP